MSAEQIEKRIRYRILEQMDTKGITVTKLSKMTGVPRQTLARWINMETPMPLHGLVRISKALGTTVEKMVKGIE